MGTSPTRRRSPPARVKLGVALASLLAAGFGVGMAYASGPGSDGDDDVLEAVDADNSGRGSDSSDSIDDIADAVDNSGPDGGDDDVADIADNSGPGGGDDDADVGGGEVDVVDNSGPGGGDDDNSGSGGGDEDNSDSGGGDEDNSGSGGGDDSSGTGDHSGSGHSGGDDDGGSSGHGGSGSGEGEGSHGSQPGAAGEAGLASIDGEQRTLTVEVDASGEERVAGEALLAGTQSDVSAALEAGFTAISQTSLPSMDCAMVRLALPAGMSVDQAISALKAIAPNAVVTANTVYQHAEGAITATPAARRSRAPSYRGVLGVIDTGVDPAALAPNALLGQRAFAGGPPTPREHGEAVAALAVEHGMRVQVADVFGSTVTGAQIASAESIAAALDWMMETRIPVINISIEGPNNALLQALIARASQRGQVIVAAAGNGGPLATPAYPAAFEGAIAVTAIDGQDRPYVRANRGGYIDFSAHGVNVHVQSGDHELVVSGTSFAAPLVAAHIAQEMQTPSPAEAAEVLSDLREHAVDLGAPGRDPIFGWGALRG